MIIGIVIKRAGLRGGGGGGYKATVHASHNGKIVESAALLATFASAADAVSVCDAQVARMAREYLGSTTEPTDLLPDGEPPDETALTESTEGGTPR